MTDLPEWVRDLRPAGKLIYAYLADDGPAPQSEIADEWGLSRETVRLAASEMQDLGVLETRPGTGGDSRYKHYHLVEESDPSPEPRDWGSD